MQLLDDPRASGSGRPNAGVGSPLLCCVIRSNDVLKHKV